MMNDDTGRKAVDLLLYSMQTEILTESMKKESIDSRSGIIFAINMIIPAIFYSTHPFVASETRSLAILFSLVMVFGIVCSCLAVVPKYYKKMETGKLAEWIWQEQREEDEVLYRHVLSSYEEILNYNRKINETKARYMTGALMGAIVMLAFLITLSMIS